MILSKIIINFGVLLALLANINFSYKIHVVKKELHKEQLLTSTEEELAAYHKKANIFLKKRDFINKYFLSIYVGYIISFFYYLITYFFGLLAIDKQLGANIAVALLLLFYCFARYNTHLQSKNKMLLLKAFEKEPNSYITYLSQNNAEAKGLPRLRQMFFISGILLCLFLFCILNK